MKQPWQSKLANFAKKHPVAKPLVLAFLMLGYRAACTGEQLRGGKAAGHARRQRPAVRVAALALVLLVLVPQFTLLAVPARGDSDVPPEEPTSQTDGTEEPPVLSSAPEIDPEIEPKTELETDLEADIETDPETGQEENQETDSEIDSETDPEQGTETPPAPEEPPAAVEEVAAWTIVEFAPLAEDVLLQAYPLGTPLEELALPEELVVTAVQRPALAEDGEEGEAPLPENEPAAETHTLPVAWTPTPAYNSEEMGEYLFASVLPEGYLPAEDAEPPVIRLFLAPAITPFAAPANPARIYVHETNGNDSSGTGTTANPYKTLSYAIGQAASTATIYLMSDVSVGAVIDFPNKTITITTDRTSTTPQDPATRATVRKTANAIPIFWLNARGNLILEDVELNGGGMTAASGEQNSSLVHLVGNTSLELKNGAVLQNNKGLNGGAVFAIGADAKVFVREGALITNNSATGSGGAVYLDGAQFTITGGEITGNAANGGQGGGIALMSSSGFLSPTATINGGTIAGNTASGKGADIYAGTGTLNITAGSIGDENSRANSKPGGYYKESAATVNATGAFSAGVLTEQGPDSVVARIVGLSTNVARYAASRFIYAQNPLSEGYVSGSNIRMSNPYPIKVQYGANPNTAVPTYYDTFAAALDAIKKSSETLITLSIRQNLDATSAPNISAGTVTGLASNKTLTIQSEVVFNASGTPSTPNIYTLNPGSGFAGTLFTLNGWKLTLESVKIVTNFNAAAIAVQSGTLTLQANASVTNSHASGTGVAITDSTGAFSMSAGAIAANTGVTAGSGTGGFTIANGTITGQSLGVSIARTASLGGTITAAAGTGASVTGGTVTVTGSISGSPGATVTNATLTLAAGSTLTATGGGTGATLGAGGRINQSGGGVSAPGGTGVVIDGAGTYTHTAGTIAAATGASLTHAQAVYNLSANGSITASGTGANITLGTFTMSGGSIDGGGTATGRGLAIGGGSASVSAGAITGHAGGVQVLGSGAFTLSGSGAIHTNAVNGPGAGVYVAGDASLTLTGGEIRDNQANAAAGNGGGIYHSSTTGFTLAGGVAIRGNVAAGDGGGIYATGASLTLAGGSVGGTTTGQGNTATAGSGGGIYYAGTGSIVTSAATTTLVAGNEAGASGGGILHDAAAAYTMQGGSVTSNTAQDGGGIAVLQADFTFSRGAVAGNHADASGGGIYMGTGAFALQGEAEVTGNTAQNGGGIYLAGGSLGIQGAALVQGNSATAAGGGIYAAGAASLAGGQVTNNTVGSGGTGSGVYLDGGGLSLSGGTLGASYLANGVSRKASEKITLAAGFTAASGAVVLEPSTPFAPDDVFYNNAISASDWVAAVPAGQEAALAACFWAIGADDMPLMGAWRQTGSQMYFVSAEITVEYFSGDTPLDTIFYPTLKAAFDAIAANALSATRATVTLKADVTAAPIALAGGVAVTLTSASSQAPVAVKRDGTGSLFTVGTGQSLVLRAVILDGTVGTGTLVSVEGGSLTLAAGAALRNNNFGTGEGAAVHAAAGSVVQNGGTFSNITGASQVYLEGTAQLAMESGGIASLSLADSATMLLKKGTIASLALAGSAGVQMDETGFDAAATSVVMKDAQQRGQAMAFLSGPALLMEDAAACFTATDAADASRKVMGGVVSGSPQWMGVVVELSVGGGPASGHTSLVRALAAIPGGTQGAPKSAVLTVLEDIPTVAVTVQGYRTVAITSPAGALAPSVIRRAAGEKGDLITVEGDASLTLQDITLAGFGTLVDGEGSLVHVNGGAFATTDATLTENANLQGAGLGGAVRVSAGSAALGTGTLLSANSAVQGGSVALTGGSLAVQAGAEVSQNAAQTAGGGVALTGGSFALEGGEIKENTVAGEVSAEGSGIDMQAGSLVLTGAPLVGRSLYGNNLLVGGGTVGIGTAGLSQGALIHVGGDASVGDIAAEKADAVTLAEAQAFRHTRAELLVGINSGQSVVWALPAYHLLYGWNTEGTAFTCQANGEDFLYLTIDGALLEPDDYTITPNSPSTGEYTFALKPAWVADHEALASGYRVLASFANGYSKGASKPIGVTVDGTETRYSTMQAAVNGINGGEEATITLYWDVVVSGQPGDVPPVIDNAKKVTLLSDETESGGVPFTVLRYATGHLLSASGSGTTLVLQDVVLDGGSIAAGGSLVSVSSAAQVTLSSGAVLQNNHTATNGGGAYVNGAGLTVNGGVITGNSAADGGGVYLADSGASLTLAAGQIAENSAARGGGAFAENGTLRLAGGDVADNTATSMGGGVWLNSRATLSVLSGTIATNNGILLYNNSGSGTLPAPAIVLEKGMLPADTTLRLEGYVSAASPPAASIVEDSLVARFAGNFTEGMAPADIESAKRAAARRIIHGSLGGGVSADGTGVVLVDAFSVQRVVGTAQPEYFSDIAEALKDLATDEPVVLTLQKDITMREKVVITALDVTLTAPDVYTALREGTLTGDLFTLSGAGASLSVAGEVVVDGGGFAAGGSLVHVNGGVLILTEDAALQNNQTAGNGGAVRVSAGSFAMAGGAIVGNAAAAGGGVYFAAAEGSLALTGGTLGGAATAQANTAAAGGGVYVAASGAFTLNGTTIQGNTATATGGGIHLAGGNLAMGGGLVTGNTAAASAGSGVYLAAGASLTLAGGKIGSSAADNGLTQQHATAQSAPGLTIAAGMAPATTNVNLEGAAIANGGAAAYADNAPVALFPESGFSYAEKLAAAAAFTDSGNAPGFYPNLAADGSGLVLRRHLTRTEPLYTEETTAPGNNVLWRLASSAGALQNVQLVVDGTPQTLTSGTDYAYAPADGTLTLQPHLLGLLENGLHEVVISTATGGDIPAAFTVDGAANVRLEGTPARLYRTLAGAVKAAGTGTSTITLLADVAGMPVVIENGQNITIQAAAPGQKTVLRGWQGHLFTVQAGGAFTLQDVAIDGNAATWPTDAGGSLVYVNGGSFTLGENALLQNNNTAGNGGGVHVVDGTARLQGGIAGNTAASGGGVYMAGGTATAAQGSIAGNTAAASGGGVALAGSAHLTAGTSGDATGFSLTNNSAAQGNGIYVDETATLLVQGGSVGAPPADKTTPLDDNGVTFHQDNPSLAAGGFAAGGGNVNLEATYGQGGAEPLLGSEVLTHADGGTAANYPALAAAAGAVHYSHNGYNYSAVAVPAAGGTFVIAAVEDVFSCYVLHTGAAGEQDVYWEFAALHDDLDVDEVHVNNAAIASTNYKLEAGSIVLTLEKAYLATLPNGTHTLECYLLGDAPNAPSFTFAFVVMRPVPGNSGNGSGAAGTATGGSPQTGDATTKALKDLWALVVASATGALACGVLVYADKDKRKNQAQRPRRPHKASG